MHILVTGAAGFIGSHFTLRLLKEGHSVVCVDSLNKYYDPALKQSRLVQFKEDVEFHEVDLTQREEVEKIFKTHFFDKVCHFAGQPGVRYSMEDPDSYVQHNYLATLVLFDVAKRHDVMDVVFASSSSVYGIRDEVPFKETDRVDEPISVYASTKRGCELLASTYCHLYNMNITCLRFFTVYGPYGRPDMAPYLFTKSIIKGEEINIYNNGDMLRDFTYISDIIDGFYKAMNSLNGFEVINLGCGKPIRLMDFITIIETVIGKEVKKNFLPMQPGDVKQTFADITKAKTMLGFTPKVSLQEGITEFVGWYKKHYDC